MGIVDEVCPRQVQEDRERVILFSSRFAKTLGPGLLFASTAIGVSHLVQSTRAGAEFGLLLIGVVIAANVLKYPFFEYGTRYASATGTSIIDGYAKLGRRILWLYLGITVASMFIVTSAVGAVGAGFFENLFNLGSQGVWTTIMLFVVCSVILVVGRYKILDSLVKIVATVLVVSTVAAFVLAAISGPAEPIEGFVERDLFEPAGIFFMIALIGWMPTAIDLSSWNSLWSLERIKQTGFRPRLSESLLEFRIGYAITAVLAVMFVMLGSYLVFGTGREIPDGGASFANAVIELYTETIGEWSRIIIAVSAFSVMFSTVITVFDGYSRSLQRTVELVRKESKSKVPYPVFLVILAAGALFVLLQFGSSIRGLVDFATTVSFLVAPAIAIINLRLVTGKYIDRESQPGKVLLALSYAGIAFLLGFSVLFIVTKLMS